MAHPNLLAAVVIASRRNGRNLYFRPEDWDSLMWQSTGEVLGWAFNDEWLALRDFHTALRPQLMEVAPTNAAVPSNAAPVAMLTRCIREGWIAPWEEDTWSDMVQLIASHHPPSAMWALARFDGSLRDFFFEELQGNTLSQWNEAGHDAYYAVGSDAPRLIPLFPALPREDWFNTDLSKIFNTWIRDNDRVPSIQMCGSSVGDERNAMDLAYQARDSLIFALAASMNGDADYLTLSKSTRLLLESFNQEAIKPKDLVRSGGRLSTGLAALRAGTTTDALAFVIDQTENLELVSELNGADGTVGGVVAAEVFGALPRSIQVIGKLAKFVVRKRRLTPRL